MRNICTGLVWPEKGNPAFYCVICEKGHDKTTSFETSKPILQVLKEGQASSLSEVAKVLFDTEKNYIKKIYTNMEPRFANYIKEYGRLKIEKNIDSRLYDTKGVLFEASILKIKELIVEKRLTFAFNSQTRTQLASFSRSSLDDGLSFYAVRALANVIWAFEKRNPSGEAEIVPKMRVFW